MNNEDNKFFKKEKFLKEKIANSKHNYIYINKNINVIPLYLLIIYFIIKFLKTDINEIYDYKMFIFTFFATAYPVWESLKENNKNFFQNCNLHIEEIKSMKKGTKFKIINDCSILNNFANLQIFDKKNNLLDTIYFQFIENGGVIYLTSTNIYKIKNLKYKINIFFGDTIITMKYLQNFNSKGNRIKDNSMIMIKSIHYNLFKMKTLLIIMLSIYAIVQIIYLIKL